MRLLFLCLLAGCSTEDPQDLARRARLQLAKGDAAAARQLAEHALELSDGPAVRLVAARATAGEDPSAAMRHLDAIADDDPVAAEALALRVRLCLGHASFKPHAESALQRLLCVTPNDHLARRQLGFLLALQGRQTEAITCWLANVQAGTFSIDELCWLAAAERPMTDDADFGQVSASDPPATVLTAAHALANDYQPERALDLLRQFLPEHEGCLPACEQLGRLLQSAGRPLVDWDRGLPPDALQSSIVWNIRGQWARQCGDTRLAALCFRHSLVLQPNQSAVCHQLSQCCERLGQTASAARLAKRGELCLQAVTLGKKLSEQSAPYDVSVIRELAFTLETLGRHTEAVAWCAVAGQQVADGWPAAMRERLRHTARQKGWVVHDAHPATWLARFESVWAPPQEVASGVRPAANSDSPVEFVNVSADLGLTLNYQFGTPPDQPQRRLFEFTGGGLAVLDFDGDGWPDLYATQAGHQPPFANQSRFRDHLYRNQRGVQFAEISATAGLVNVRFGQGVAAGDINNDGFPDLYVANIDGNQLFVNNGDGTFTDVTSSSGVGHAGWTTSCAIADLDHDGLPDLYDLTFVKEAYDKVCPVNGAPHSCIPGELPADDNVFWRGTGHGHFENATHEMQLTASDGDGLGLVIGQFAEAPLSVFVANDGRPNFLFEGFHEEAEVVAMPYFDRASAAGVALDSLGQAQACMGIAVADFDGDEQIDLFVTNFYSESNTLYRQLAPGLFDDQTSAFRLTEPSRAMLGFGAQALDADNDGWPDLLVANGHVDDFTADGIPYRMPPQFYHNEQGQHFTLATADGSGPFFDQPTLGRSVVRWDFNRDGLPDAVIGRLDESIALLANTTSTPNHSVSVRLVDVKSARDAVGAVVVCTVNGRKLRAAVTAGDGYHASNERVLHFGLGDADVIDRLEVHWPDGRQQSWRDVPVSDADGGLILRSDMSQGGLFAMPK
ncbi:MAG: FG-GAP-like repeat-containing protein [Planctomycetaceae bacterium]|nr:FG-GAP-like repeat-containing protein [Planctomycetaceae bacterium]